MFGERYPQARTLRRQRDVLLLQLRGRALERASQRGHDLRLRWIFHPRQLVNRRIDLLAARRFLDERIPEGDVPELIAECADLRRRLEVVLPFGKFFSELDDFFADIRPLRQQDIAKRRIRLRRLGGRDTARAHQQRNRRNARSQPLRTMHGILRRLYLPRAAKGYRPIAAKYLSYTGGHNRCLPSSTST